MQKILLSSSPKRDPPGLNRNCQYEKGHRRGCQRWHQGDNCRRRRGQFRGSVAFVTRTSANRDLAAVMYGVIACWIFRWEFGFFEFFLFLQKFVILKNRTLLNMRFTLYCGNVRNSFFQKFWPKITWNQSIYIFLKYVLLLLAICCRKSFKFPRCVVAFEN